MKNFITKLLFIVAFILCFVTSVFAADLKINSVTYDNSGTFVSINSFDNENYSLTQTPKLYIVSDENKAYFDIEASYLTCPPQDIVLSSKDIKEVLVKQFSTEPNIVRVVIKYNEGFNPKNIQLKRVANTFVIRFKTTQVKNYYFQQVYADTVSAVSEFYENIVVQYPVLASQNMVSQINSAFKLGSTTEDKNYILTKKDLDMPTMYYLDDITVKNGGFVISGAGNYILTKPLILSNPTRIVYDIPNAILNSSLRNREVYISESESIKAGQFDKRTVRLVITAADKDKYLPVYSSDNQRLAFVDKNSTVLPFSATRAVLMSVQDEINDTTTHSVKLFFSKPVEYSIVRENKSFDLYLHNAEKAQEVNLKSSMVFSGAKFTSLKNGGIKLSIPLIGEDSIDVHAGADAKTLRVRIKSPAVTMPVQKVTEPKVPEILPPVKVDHKGKIYVVIDPGHGGSDCGANRSGIYEKNITLDISKRVEKLLTQKGYEVFMTRFDDSSVSLQERVEFSENLQPDIFVSIHVNSSNSSTPKGLETHYYKDNSLTLAKTVHASMLNHVNASNRGLFKSKFYVINHTTAPAILVEIGFISNDTERAQLVTESRKQATAKAIAEGINDYFKK